MHLTIAGLSLSQESIMLSLVKLKCKSDGKKCISFHKQSSGVIWVLSEMVFRDVNVVCWKHIACTFPDFVVSISESGKAANGVFKCTCDRSDFWRLESGCHNTHQRSIKWWEVQKESTC